MFIIIIIIWIHNNKKRKRLTLLRELKRDERAGFDGLEYNHTVSIKIYILQYLVVWDDIKLYQQQDL